MVPACSSCRCWHLGGSSSCCCCESRALHQGRCGYDAAGRYEQWRPGVTPIADSIRFSMASAWQPAK